MDITEIQFANTIEQLPLLYNKINTKTENKYQIIIDGVLGAEYEFECRSNWENNSIEARNEKRTLSREFGELEKRIQTNRKHKNRICKKGCCPGGYIKYAHDLKDRTFISSAKFSNIFTQN